MRLIMEGGCGAGKSTLAEALSTITATPVYRPFRTPGTHITQKQMDFIRQDIGLAINGWEEDLYVADLLSVVNASVILDRSLPSALAYNGASSEPLPQRQVDSITRLWMAKMSAARATLVLVECAEAKREERSPHRGGKWEVDAINRIAYFIAHNSTIDVWRVDTTHTPTNILAAALARRIMLGQSSDLITVLSPVQPPKLKPVFLDG